MDLATCPECGKQVKAMGIGTHRRKAHGIPGAKHGKDNGTAESPRALPARRDEVKPARRKAAAVAMPEPTASEKLRVRDLEDEIQLRIEELCVAQRVIRDLAARMAAERRRVGSVGSVGSD